jgi:hypothetical protein
MLQLPRDTHAPVCNSIVWPCHCALSAGSPCERRACCQNISCRSREMSHAWSGSHSWLVHAVVESCQASRRAPPPRMLLHAVGRTIRYMTPSGWLPGIKVLCNRFAQVFWREGGRSVRRTKKGSGAAPQHTSLPIGRPRSSLFDYYRIECTKIRGPWYAQLSKTQNNSTEHTQHVHPSTARVSGRSPAPARRRTRLQRQPLMPPARPRLRAQRLPELEGPQGPLRLQWHHWQPARPA